MENQYLLPEGLRNDLRNIILESKQTIATTSQVIKILNNLQNLPKAETTEDATQKEE